MSIREKLTIKQAAHQFVALLGTCKKVLLTLLFMVFLSPASQASGISYDSKNLRINLSSPVQKAIDSGVTLTFICEYAMIDKFLAFTWVKERKQHQFVVSRHALSNRYLVRNEASLEPGIYRSIPETMNHITDQALDLFNRYHNSNDQYQMRLSLSKYELLGPMRLNAFINDAWDLDSGWKTWLSER